jgi:hypothetical protein
MKPTFILEALNLKTIYGWELNALTNNAEENFYNGILENNAICLAWISIKKEISIDELNVHHFKRNSANLPGIENSLPCFLIVTNGKNWFVSKTNDNTFSEIKLEGLIELLANELTEMADVLKTKNYDSIHITNIIRSVYFMKRKINLFPNESKRIKSKSDYINEIHQSTLYKKEDGYSNELFFGKPETLSQLLEHKINEAYILSQVLHRVLIKNYSPRQIETLLQLKDFLLIHVEIVRMNADLIFCRTACDLNSKLLRNKEEVIKYYKINAKGEISRHYAKSLEEKKELKKGLFSVCKHTLTKLINKK